MRGTCPERFLDSKGLWEKNKSIRQSRHKGIESIRFIGIRIARLSVRARVLRYCKEFEVAVEQNRRAIWLVRALNLQFPILAHFLYAAEGIVEVTLRGKFQSFWPREISPKLLAKVYLLNKLR